jgi:hypothetical protein
VLLASVVSIALAAEPGPLTTRFSAGVDGAAAGLLQLGSTHERFASMGQGWSGALAAELQLVDANRRWLVVGLGLRGNVGHWQGTDSALSLWAIGVRVRFELHLWRLRPWLGVGYGLGNVSARGHMVQEAAAGTNSLAAGLRFHVAGQVVVGVGAESVGVTPFSRPDDRLRTWQLGGELVLEFDLGERSPVSAR